MAFKLKDIPQADRFEKVIATVKAVNSGATTDSKIAAVIGFSDRQGRYYRHAAEILGFIANDRNNASITEFGKELDVADVEKKFNLSRKAVYDNEFLKTIIDYLSSNVDGYTEGELIIFISNITEADAHTTIPRRIKTILSWFLYLDIIAEDGDKYVINQSTYTGIDEKVVQTGLYAEYLYGAGNKTLQQIDIENISPNPHNPRLVFEIDELNELKSSIDKVGILVPLTVYRNTKSFPKTDYVLLDGERRWRCAKELNLSNVPANVIDEPKDITQNILFMFNIHHFRKEWALFPTALKLEVIIEKIGTDNESVLAEFTGVSRSTIRRCKTLLWYPQKFRDVLLEKTGRISTDFFIELYPIAVRLSYEDQFSYPDKISKFIDRCIDKFNEQIHIQDVKEFREVRKAMGFYEKNGNFTEFLNNIDIFLSNDVGLEIFNNVNIQDERDTRNIVRYISYLNSHLASIDPNIISDFVIEDQLRILNKHINAILDLID